MTVDTSKLIEEQRNYLASSPLVVDKFRRVLKHGEIVDIILRSMAYTLGLEDEARRAYLYDTYEVSSLEELMKTDFRTSIQRPVKHTQIITPIKSRAWKNSLSKVVLADVNLRKPLRQLLHYKDSGDDIHKTTNQEIEEYSLEFINKYRKDEALKIQKEYKLDTNLELWVLEQIKTIVKDKEYVNEQDMSAIRFLENEGVETGLRSLYLDLGWLEQYQSLGELRQTGGEVLNTACYACRKTLYGRGSLHFCKQVENRSCYEARKQLEKQQAKKRDSEVIYVMSKQLCMKCGKASDFSYTCKIGGKVCIFCSNRCCWAYRKTPEA